MKNRFTLLVMVIIGAVLFTACGNKPDKDDPVTEKNQGEAAEAENEENVNAVVNAISDAEIRFPVFIDDESHIEVVSSNATINGTTYGFDNPETGISVYAFAEQNGLNEEQAQAIWGLLSTDDVYDIPEKYPDDFSYVFPYKGADIDYMTLSNVKTEPSGKDDNNLRITADLNVHLHLLDGTEAVEVYEVSKVPEIGDTPLDEKSVEWALDADKMNEKLPNEERSFYKEKGAESDE